MGLYDDALFAYGLVKISFNSFHTWGFISYFLLSLILGFCRKKDEIDKKEIGKLCKIILFLFVIWVLARWLMLCHQ